MTSALPPSPFLNSTVSPRAVGSAVASSDLQPRATAELPSKSTLDPATGVDAAAGPEFADPPVPAAAIIADPDGGYMGHRLSPALGTSVGSAAIDLCQEPMAASHLDQTDHIHEIFHYVRKLMRGHQGFVLDADAFMADVEEIPLFIREGSGLRRWSA